MKSKALVVLSGGQDSVTCLGLALKKHDEVECIGFVYGQKHSVEIQCAVALCKELDIKYTIVQIPALQQFNDSALIQGNGQGVNDEHEYKEELPASFVPARNATFLTLAHGYAQKIKANVIITGVCQTDYSGYPDCRNEFIEQLETALNTGYETNILIDTPLMWLTKSETFKLAEEIDFLTHVIEKSHTCYNGVRVILHRWGYGCGECGACELRAKGFEEFDNGRC